MFEYVCVNHLQTEEEGREAEVATTYQTRYGFDC